MKPVKVAAADAPVQQVVLQGRGRRPLRAAGASAARRGRRALHLRRPRRHAVPRHRPPQHRLPPHHAARAARGRHRHDRAERRARDLSRGGREGREDAGRLCGRLAPVRFHGGGQHEPADGRARGARRAARRAGADRQMRHQRHPGAGRRRIRAGGLSRRQGPRRAGGAVRRIRRLLRRREDATRCSISPRSRTARTRCSRP